MTKKVGQNTNTDSTDGKSKKEKKVRIDFDKSTAVYVDKDGNIVSAVNSEGQLIAVPVLIKDEDGKVNYTGWDVRKHLPLKKADFAGMAVFLRYQAFVARLRVITFTKVAENKEAQADRLEKYGDEATRKKAARISRMREQLATLEASLAEEGVVVEDA